MNGPRSISHAGGDVRPVAVAGLFYPTEPGELQSLVDTYLAEIDVVPRPAVMSCPSVWVEDVEFLNKCGIVVTTRSDRPLHGGFL